MCEFLNVGAKVAFTENTEIHIGDERLTDKTGTVIKDFGEIGIVAVDFDGNVLKIPRRFLKKVETKSEDSKPEGVTLTREQFQKLAMKVLNPSHLAETVNNEMDPSRLITVSLTGMIVIQDLEKEIFGSEGQ